MIANVEGIITKWVADNAELGKGKVFLAYQNHRTPTTPYIVVETISGPTPISSGRHKYNTTSQNFDHILTYNLTVQLSVYSNETTPLVIVDRLLHALCSSETRIYFDSNNIVNTDFFNFGIINEANIQNTNFLRRAVLELEFLFESTNLGAEELMATVDIEPEGELEDKMQNIVVNL